MRLGLAGVVVASIRLLAERRGVGGQGTAQLAFYNLIRPGQGDAVQKLVLPLRLNACETIWLSCVTIDPSGPVFCRRHSQSLPS